MSDKFTNDVNVNIISSMLLICWVINTVVTLYTATLTSSYLSHTATEQTIEKSIKLATVELSCLIDSKVRNAVCMEYRLCDGIVRFSGYRIDLIKTVFVKINECQVHLPV